VAQVLFDVSERTTYGQDSDGAGLTGRLQDSIRERLVVSPCRGRFLPLPPESFTAEGEWVEPGQTVATIETGDETVPVRSNFRGWMMGARALAGHRVARGEPLLWVWSS
jgi:biotin carboxyl carrier protein